MVPWYRSCRFVEKPNRLTPRVCLFLPLSIRERLSQLHRPQQVFLIAEASSTGSSTSRILHAVGLTDIGHDLPAAAHKWVIGRGASSGSQNGPQALQIRGEVQGGADPTDRLLSPVEHQGAGRVVRRLHGAARVGESLEALNRARADGIQFLEDRTPS